MYPKSLKELIEAFKYLPGIGEKTAERLAFSILNFEDCKTESFIKSIKNSKENLNLCSVCNSLIENDDCPYCNDTKRNKKVICVVEDPKTVFLIEKLHIFNGIYHVLEGLISPLNGVNPEDIGLQKFLDRIKNNEYEEIIFAFKPSIEGETTSLYIKKVLDGLNIKITKLANGLPIGADMEYIDTLTLEKAISDRKEIS